MSFVGLIPCRAGSERVERKNVRPFANFDRGLIELKLRQMATCPIFSEIVVSTNDPEVIDFALRFSELYDPRVVVIERPDYLGSSNTSMTQFIRYVANLRSDGILFWTHVTSPFVSAQFCEEVGRAYESALIQGYDSLVTVNKLHKFLWDKNGPVNYDNKKERWPRSQDIKPLFEINHGVYVIPFSIMREQDDRMGRHPLFYETPEVIALDIDWEEQFDLLATIAQVRPDLLGSLVL